MGGKTHLGFRAEGAQVALQISPRHQLHDDHSGLALGHHPEEANLEAPKAKESRLHPLGSGGQVKSPAKLSPSWPHAKAISGSWKGCWAFGPAEAGIGESPEKSLVWETKSAPWKRRTVSLSVQFRGFQSRAKPALNASSPSLE